MSFFVGFAGATLIGVIARILSRSLAIIQAEHTRMTSPPRPILKPIEPRRLHGINTDPDVSPITVLNRGCARIAGHLLFLVVFWAGIISVLFIFPRDVLSEPIPEDTGVGFLFAVFLGLLVNAIISNWQVILQLYRRMIKPPKPTLAFECPPNRHTVAATPPLSPQEVVVGGCLEIMLRMIVELLLLVGLGLLFREMVRYLLR
jgi:hypothetical protein